VRAELRLLIVAAVALTAGALGAETYARLAIPYYSLIAHWVAAGHPWQIIGLEIAPGQSGPGALLRLKGALLGATGDGRPSAILISKLQVAAVVESPLIFWATLMLWPMRSYRQRLVLLGLGIPVFLCLEAATTVSQLLGPFADGTALMGGAVDPLTVWDRWSRFLEAGGRVALALCAAIFTISVVKALQRITVPAASKLHPPISHA
jgi:hypothetical protein